MSAVAAPRFIVREVTGFAIHPGKVRPMGGKSREGLTVWVADEAYNGREIRTWRSEDGGYGTAAVRHAKMRAKAAELAVSLNAREREDATYAALVSSETLDEFLDAALS